MVLSIFFRFRVWVDLVIDFGHTIQDSGNQEHVPQQAILFEENQRLQTTMPQTDAW